MSDVRDDLTELAEKDKFARKAIVYAFLALLSLNAMLLYWGGQAAFNYATSRLDGIDRRLAAQQITIEDVKRLYLSKEEALADALELNKDRQRNLSNINDHLSRLDTMVNLHNEKLDRIDDKYEAQFRALYMEIHPARTPKP